MQDRGRRHLVGVEGVHVRVGGTRGSWVCAVGRVGGGGGVGKQDSAISSPQPVRAHALARSGCWAPYGGWPIPPGFTGTAAFRVPRRRLDPPPPSQGTSTVAAAGSKRLLPVQACRRRCPVAAELASQWRLSSSKFISCRPGR